MNEIVEHNTTGKSPFDAIRRSREDGTGYLYVIGFDGHGLVKVGWSASNPRRRLDLHRRNARSFLQCNSFTEWVSPFHAEARTNERALIRWCQGRSSSVYSGEHFRLPYDAVLAYAKTLPLTEASEPSRGLLHQEAWQMELLDKYAAIKAIRDAVGEDGESTLSRLLAPGYPIPEWALDEVTDAAVRGILDSLGLGCTQIDAVAGLLILRVKAATAGRVAEANRAESRRILAEVSE